VIEVFSFILPLYHPGKPGRKGAIDVAP
jgi:hypothetical protein